MIANEFGTPCSSQSYTQAENSIMLIHDTNKGTKPKTFIEAYCKGGIHPEGQTRVTLKTVQTASTAIAETNPKH